MLPLDLPAPITRREMLRHIGGGFGTLGLAGVLAGGGFLTGAGQAASSRTAGPLAAKPTHFPPRAKRVIFLFMNGGPSHVDTFDPKPALAKHHGQDPPKAGASRKSGRKLMRSPFR